MGGQYIEAMPDPTLHQRPARWPALADWRRRLPAWPRQCELCRGWGPDSLCAACVDRLAAPQPRCPHCALPSTAGRVCGDCLRDPPPFDHAVAALDYDFPWDRLILRLKFRAEPELARCLAELLATAVLHSQQTRPDWLLPVPLSAQRLRQRGYNQAWELARCLGARCGIAALPQGLVRGRDTKHQLGLSRSAREANLRHGLWVDPGCAHRVQGRQVALVDDVMTTGATARAAAQALRQAGAAGVQVWVLARTPRAD